MNQLMHNRSHFDQFLAFLKARQKQLLLWDELLINNKSYAHVKLIICKRHMSIYYPFLIFKILLNKNVFYILHQQVHLIASVMLSR